MDKLSFYILRYLAESRESFCIKLIADSVDCQLCDVELRIDEACLKVLEPYKVRNAIILTGIDEHSLLQAVTTAVYMNDNGNYGIPVPNYVEENVSTKVVKIIQSYTGVVDKMVWRKF